MFIIGHAVSWTQLVFRHATGTQLGLKWQKRKDDWLFTERGRGLETRKLKLGWPCPKRDSNSGPLCRESSALTIWSCCLFNEMLILRDVSLIVPQPIWGGRFWPQEKNNYQTCCLSGTSNEQEHLPLLKDWTKGTNDNRSGLIGNYWKNTNHKPEFHGLQSWSKVCGTEFNASANICLFETITVLQLFVTIMKLHCRDTYQLGKLNWQARCLLRSTQKIWSQPRLPQIFPTSEKEFKFKSTCSFYAVKPTR